jgi:hypothetical protein
MKIMNRFPLNFKINESVTIAPAQPGKVILRINPNGNRKLSLKKDGSGTVYQGG